MKLLLQQEWHPHSLEYSSETEIIANFLQDLPQNFTQFFDNKTSNLLEILPTKKNTYLTGEKVKMMFRKSKAEYNKQLKKVFTRKNEDSQYQYIPHSEKINIDTEMSIAGFLYNGIQIKISLLNGLWHRIIRYVRQSGMRFLNFLDRYLCDLLDDFFRALLSIMRSLRAIFPQVEIFCELVEFITGVPLIPDE